MKHQQGLDRVSLLGCVLGVLSLFLGWLALGPNRLASGTTINLWNAFGLPGAVAIALLWFSCLFLTLFRSYATGMAATIVANALLVLTLLLTGSAASRLVDDTESMARVSISGGLYLSVAGGWIVAFASIKPLPALPRYVIALTGLACATAIVASGWLNDISILVEYAAFRARFWNEVVQHLKLTAISVLAATVIGLPLGFWATRNRLARAPVFFVSTTVQTIPSLALFGLLIAPLSALSFAYPGLRQIGIRGVGAAPAVIALTLYCILPIVQNTYAGLLRVDRYAIDAARGMGMTRWQIFHRIELQLAAPVVLEGIRTASVQAVGLTTVAALIGAGGLGWFVFRGIGQAAPDLILIGAIPIIALALVMDYLMSVVVKLGTPRGGGGKT